MKINNKKEFYDLAEKGLCGNTPRVWRDRFSFQRDRESGRFDPRRNVGMRTLIPGDGRGIAVIDPINAYIRMRFCPGVYYISEIPPRGAAEGRGLQGEFTWVNGAWWLYYTYDMGYMRQRLAESGQHAYGWAAIRLLRGHLAPEDFEMLMELFDRYTEDDDYPIIEFANFGRPWGQLDRNLIIWEIRNGY